MNSKLLTLLMMVALVLWLAGCGLLLEETASTPKQAVKLAAVKLAEGEKLKVVASTSIIGDLITNVAGNLIDLTVLIPIGADLHTFSPTPQDLAAIADAHVIFVNGLGAEETLLESLQNAGGQAALVTVSAGIEARQMSGSADHDAEDHVAEEHDAEEHDAEDHDHAGDDPHVWTTPHNAVTMVGNIEQALAGLDPAHAQRYQSQAATYTARLEALESWVQGQIDTIPEENRKLVTDHTSFGYYADRYGLTQVGAVIPSFSTAAEPSAQELADLTDAIRKYKVPAIFVGSTVNPTVSERVAQDTGTRLLTVYTGSLGPTGSGAESYVQYIEYNTNTVVRGLQ